jgi:RimJ/RimL family protein N-acetyltransferase
MAVAEMTNIIQLGELLDAEFSYGWPPPENNEKTMEWFFNKIYSNPEHRGWLIWYFVNITNSKRTVIGNGVFTGPPDENGVVECGYSILKPAQSNGFATEAVGGLIKWALTHNSVKKIAARTNPENISSRKVLEKNGFIKCARGCPEGKTCYEFER